MEIKYFFFGKGIIENHHHFVERPDDLINLTKEMLNFFMYFSSVRFFEAEAKVNIIVSIYWSTVNSPSHLKLFQLL